MKTEIIVRSPGTPHVKSLQMIQDRLEGILLIFSTLSKKKYELSSNQINLYVYNYLQHGDYYNLLGMLQGEIQYFTIYS